MNLLTIAINTYSGRNRTYLSKLSVHLDKQRDKSFETLIIADGDSEFIKDLEILFKNARIIQTKDLNLAQSRNKAIKDANSDIVVFIDDDAYPDELWTKKIADLFTNSEVIGGGGYVETIFEKKNKIPFELYWLFGCTYFKPKNSSVEIRNPIGCNMAVRKKNAVEIGGFDEKMGRAFGLLLSGEETDFFIRLNEKFPDKKIVYDHTAIVNHHISAKRLKYGYILKRSFFEGVTKKLLKKKRKKVKTLKTEKNYLSLLLFKSIPNYLLKGSLSAVFYIISCIFYVALGYILTPFIHNKNRM